MNLTISWRSTLTGDEVAAIDAMLNRVSDFDGVSSLSEHTYLHILAGGGPGDQHAVVRLETQIVGYAFVDDGVGELLVDPAVRNRGIGASVLQQVLARGQRIWAHGQLPAARALASRAGLVPVRQLCRYTRSLADVPQRPFSEGFTVRTFTEADTDAWLDLNAEAFVDLPDQGSWTEQDLAQRLRQPWFDADGFLLAFDDQGLVGFHWTKVHHGSVGEVYVLGVAPRAQGSGLGSALTCAGLAYLRDQGLKDVMLYVDTSNAAAVGMYTRLGFVCADCDVQYAVASGSPA